MDVLQLAKYADEIKAAQRLIFASDDTLVGRATEQLAHENGVEIRRIHDPSR